MAIIRHVALPVKDDDFWYFMWATTASEPNQYGPFGSESECLELVSAWALGTQRDCHYWNVRKP